MWRAIPLTKIVLRMLVFGVVLVLALGLIMVVMFDWSIPEPRSYYHPQIIKGQVIEGASLGALIGIALAIYAGVFHRTIHKPHHFKFAFVIIALISSLAIVQELFHIATFTSLGVGLSWAFSDLKLGSYLVVTIAKHVAICLMSLYVAGRYRSDASARFMQSTEQKSE